MHADTRVNNLAFFNTYCEWCLTNAFEFEFPQANLKPLNRLLPLAVSHGLHGHMCVCIAQICLLCIKLVISVHVSGHVPFVAT